MKKMKRTKKSAIIAGCMAGILAVTGAFAFLTDYDSAENKFKFLDADGNQTIEIDLVEPNWDETDADQNGTPDAAENAIYGNPVSKDPKVMNLGENSVYSFVKVLVPTKTVITANDDGTWVHSNTRDSEGNWIGLPTELFTLHGLDTTNWTLVDTKVDLAQGYTAYVYAYNETLDGATVDGEGNPVTDETTNLFTSVEMVNLVNDQLTPDDNINIYVDAYAIQSAGVTAPDAGDLATGLKNIWDIYVNDAEAAASATFDYFAPLA